MTPTPRQLDLLRFFDMYTRQHGLSPTMKEIGDAMGITKVTVFEMVEELIRKKILFKEMRYHSRSLRLLPGYKIPTKVTTPKEFAEKMKAISTHPLFDANGSPYPDTMSNHEDADELMSKLLKELGYSEGAETFDKMDKWYS